MQMNLFKAGLTLVIIFCLLFTQLSLLVAGEKLKVAFLGLEFENLPESIQNDITDQLHRMLTRESSLQVLGEDELKDMLPANSNGINYYRNPGEKSLSELALKLDVDYIYGGYLSNNNRSSDRVLLVGEFYRYDRASNLRHKFEVLKYYEDLNGELTEFQAEFVRSIVGGEDGGFKLLPLIVLAGIALSLIHI